MLLLNERKKKENKKNVKDFKEIFTRHYFKEFDYFGKNHSYKGSLVRHLTFEKLIDFVQGNFFKIFGDIDYSLSKMKLKSKLYSIIIFFYGINCNFELRKIFQYIRWWNKYD